MKEIDIKETIKDKETWFNIKRLNVQGLNDDFIAKTFDLSNIDQEITAKLRGSETIFEKSKFIRQPKTIIDINKESDGTKIKSYFGWRRWLDEKFWVNTLTLNFDPYREFGNFNSMDGFLSYYYEFSKRFVFIPNIKTSKNVYSSEKPFQRSTLPIIDCDTYAKFVDDCFEFMSSKNNKPIFVPISMSFSINEIKNLVEDYIKKNRFYFWIDFESQPVDEVRTARIKTVNRLYESAGYFDKALAFFTNIKREIISKRKSDLSPASDILGTVYGANIVGVDKDPPRMFGQPLPTGQLRMQILGHKARDFDSRTYYYVKSTDNPTKSRNVTNNSLKLGNEVQRQKQHFLETAEIVNYLSTKQMLQTFSDGRILSDIRKANRTQTTLDLI